MSSCERSSWNVALPAERGEPGTIWGVGIGVGIGVGEGVGVGVGRIGGCVGLTGGFVGEIVEVAEIVGWAVTDGDGTGLGVTKGVGVGFGVLFMFSMAGAFRFMVDR